MLATLKCVCEQPNKYTFTRDTVADAFKLMCQHHQNKHALFFLFSCVCLLPLPPPKECRRCYTSVLKSTVCSTHLFFVVVLFFTLSCKLKCSRSVVVKSEHHFCNSVQCNVHWNWVNHTAISPSNGITCKCKRNEKKGIIWYAPHWNTRCHADNSSSTLCFCIGILSSRAVVVSFVSL